MSNLSQKFLSDFKSFPIVVQALCIAFIWVFLFFTCDAWFSPFYFKGYQLISYIFAVTFLSAWLAHHSFYTLIRSPTLWDWSSATSDGQSVPTLPRPKITLKDVSDRELSHLARSASTSVSDFLHDESQDGEEFVNEIHNQVEDIFHSLSVKLSKVEVESFSKNLIQILHAHIKSYMKSISKSQSHHSGGVVNTSRHVINKEIFSHPVSRGEITLEAYLDTLSHAIMKEFIPGSIQDCTAIFDLGCAAFCSQLLLKFIHQVNQPEILLQSFLNLLEPKEPASHLDSTDTTDFSAPDQNSASFKEDLSLLKQVFFPTDSAVETADAGEEVSDEPLSGSSPRDRIRNPFNDDREVGQVITRRSSSPVLAGSLISSGSLVSNAGKSYGVETGLCSSVSTATAPLLSIQSENDPAPNSTSSSTKPNSLALAVGNGAEGKGDAQSGTGSTDTEISPVYEDVEDFASAIAKLRSLLEQRHVTEPSSTKNNKDIFSPLSDGNGRNYSSGGEGESSFEELAEASELPNDNRIFLNIKIPRTEVCTLPGEGQHSVYCIVYDGIYTAVSSVGGSSNPSSHGSVEEGPKDSRLVLKSRTVRRRFRQFMQLHSQLEASEDPAIVQAIRSIRGPSKWLNLPFSRLDQNTTLHRQTFLERYMSHLAGSVPISTCAELRQFLDYELHLNEVSSAPSSAALQRVAFFGKTVSSVMQSIKTALPLPLSGFDSEQSRPLQLLPLPPPAPAAHVSLEPLGTTDRDVKLGLSLDESDGRQSPVACRIVYSNEEGKLEQLLSNWNQHMDCRIESAYEAFESHLSRSELNLQPDTVSQESVIDQTSILTLSAPEKKLHYDDWDRFDSDLPLASSLINLVVDCLGCQDTWLTKAPVTIAVKILAGQNIEKLFQETLHQLAAPDRLVGKLRQFRKKLDETAADLTMTEPKDVDVDKLVAQVVHMLESKLPGLATRLLGETLNTSVLTTIVSCFADAKRNRDLALIFLDFFFAQISSLGDTAMILRPSPA